MACAKLQSRSEVGEGTFEQATAAAVPQDSCRLTRFVRHVNRGLIVLLGMLLGMLMLVGVSSAQEIKETTRKLIAKTAPTYPDMAKKMHLTGKVKLEIVISPGGAVTSAKLAGGSPVFEKNAVDAVRQWRYEPSDKETKTVVLVEFTDR